MEQSEIKVGVPVIYWSVIEDSQRHYPTKTAIRSECWTLGSGTVVCKVVGITGGVDINHLHAITPGSLLAAKLSGLKEISQEEIDTATKDFFSEIFSERGMLVTFPADKAAKSNMETPEKKVAFTNGPWRAVLYVPSERATWPHKGADGFLISESQTNTSNSITIHSTLENMTDVFGSCMGGHLAEVLITHDGLEQAKVNARLIALAPELYDTLSKIESISSTENKGVAGATWGDTNYDSESVAYGYNLAMEVIQKYASATLSKATL